MKDLHDEHFAEMHEAQIEHNRAIEAAQAAYNDAVHKSREKLAAAIEARLGVWNGEAPANANTARMPKVDVGELEAEMERQGDGGEAERQTLDMKIVEASMKVAAE